MIKFFLQGLLLVSCCIWLVACSAPNRFSPYNRLDRQNSNTLLVNDSIRLSLQYPGDYEVENKVTYREYRRAKKLLPFKMPVRYRYLLYKAHASDPDYENYVWRLPSQLIDTKGLASLAQWKQRNNYYYAIDTTAVPGTALMVGLHPHKKVDYLFLVKAKAEAKRPLPFKTEQMKQEYFKIWDSLELDE